jgi:hypothetical protein
MSALRIFWKIGRPFGFLERPLPCPNTGRSMVLSAQSGPTDSRFGRQKAAIRIKSRWAPEGDLRRVPTTVAPLVLTS